MIPGADPAKLPSDRPEPGDERLMSAWAQGDIGAFELLYARHRGPLLRFLIGQLRNQSLAEEFFQDVGQRVIARGQAGSRTPRSVRGCSGSPTIGSTITGVQKHRPPAPADGDERIARVVDAMTPEHELCGFQQRRRL